MRRWIVRLVLAGLAVFGLLQLVPYGWWHDNPPVVADAPWPDAASAEIARVACYDCHSNETDWPAYSYVAPMSWLVRRDVERGREALNFSEWEVDDNEAHDAAEEVEGGDMPPSNYVRLHSDADLSDEEVAQLVAALEAMDEDVAEEAEEQAEDGDDSDNSGPGNAEDRGDRDDEDD